MDTKVLPDAIRAARDYTELRTQSNRQHLTRIADGEWVEDRRSATSGASVRVRRDGRWGFAASPDTDADALNALCESARDNARFLASHHPASNCTLPRSSACGERKFVLPASEATGAERVEILRELDARLRRVCEREHRRALTLRVLEEQKRLVTSDGAVHRLYLPRCVLKVDLVLEGRDGGRVALCETLGGLGRFEDHFEDTDAVVARLETLVVETRRKAEGCTAESGLQSVVLDCGVSGVLAHEAFGHALEADIAAAGSFASDRLGEPLANEAVTLVDFAHHAFGELCPAPVFVDDEGMDAADVTLLRKGRLAAYLHNKESAARSGGTAAGNARASTYAGEPLIRMRNTALLPGHHSLEELIGSVERGYFLQRAGNGQSDTNGEFTLGIVQGCEIRNGRLGRAIRDTTITGRACDVLGGASLLSDRLRWQPFATCSKGQSLPVGIGGPAIRCRVRIGERR